MWEFKKIICARILVSSPWWNFSGISSLGTIFGNRQVYIKFQRKWEKTVATWDTAKLLYLDKDERKSGDDRSPNEIQMKFPEWLRNASWWDLFPRAMQISSHPIVAKMIARMNYYIIPEPFQTPFSASRPFGEYILGWICKEIAEIWLINFMPNVRFCKILC